MKRLLSLITLATILLLAACGKTPEPQATADASLAVSRSNVNTGDEVTLQWKVSNAASARLSSNNVLVLVPTAVELTGSMDVRVTASAVFTVTAFDRNGKALASAEAAVTVRAPGSPGDGPGTDPDPEDPDNPGTDPDPEDPDNPGTDPDPENPGALRFDFSDAVGLQLGTLDTAGQLLTQNSTQPSGLLKITRSGALVDPLVSGNVTVNHFVIRNSRIYLLLQPDNVSGSDANACILAEITEDNDIRCLDEETSNIEINSIQFDDHGGVYYEGYANGQRVIRRSQDGNIIDYYNVQDTYLYQFFVTPDGIVIVRGMNKTPLGERYWIRSITSAGVVRDLHFPVEHGSGWEILGFLPDGSLAVRTGNGLGRVLLHEGVAIADERAYACESVGGCGGKPARFSISEVIPTFWSARFERTADQALAFAAEGAYLLFPTIERLPIPYRNFIDGAVGHSMAVVAGTDNAGNPAAGYFDFYTRMYTDILQGRRIDVFRLKLQQDHHRILLYGLNMDTNRPVLAEYDLIAKRLEVAQIAGSLSDEFDMLDWSVNHIAPYPSVWQPEPIFEYIQEDGATDSHTVHFDAGATPMYAFIDHLEWDFGDGNTTTSTEPSHTYAVPGSYEVTLNVTNDHGQTAHYMETILINSAEDAGETTQAN